MRLDMLAWQQGRILPQACRPHGSPERAHDGIQWELESLPTLNNTGGPHQHQQQPPGGGQAQVPTTDHHQLQNVPQVQQRGTGVGELKSSPTGEPFTAPAYIAPLQMRAPQGFLPDPRYTLDHAGQAHFFEPNFQQW